jgi:hypothetical protein
MKASDADREQIAERLRTATAEGRLLAEELEHRLDKTFAARTYGELDVLVADLPGGESVPRRRGSRPTTVQRLRSVPPLALVFAIPVLFAVVIAVMVVIASLFTVWAIVAVIGWWLFGYRRGAHPGRALRQLHGCRRMQDGRARTGAGRSFWV